MKGQLQRINYKLIINTLDTGEHKEYKKEWILRGNLSVLFRKWISIVEESDYYWDRKGRWYSIRLKLNNKQ